jgi:hypothetical protein
MSFIFGTFPEFKGFFKLRGQPPRAGSERREDVVDDLLLECLVGAETDFQVVQHEVKE